MRRLDPKRWTVDRRFRIAREWSNDELKKVAHCFSGEIVNVSGWEDRDKQGGRYRDYFTAGTAYSITNYSTHSGATGRADELELDLSTGELPAELQQRFDVVFNHTVLEHVFEVRRAFRNLCEMSRDVVILIVPFCQKQHENVNYRDYWRFTPTCMRAMFEENGFEVLYESESPHNDSAIYLFFVASRNPERWRGVLPVHEPVREAGRWIGRHRGLMSTRIGRGVARRLGWLVPVEGLSSDEDH